jgi:hypothetical protein
MINKSARCDENRRLSDRSRKSCPGIELHEKRRSGTPPRLVVQPSVNVSEMVWWAAQRAKRHLHRKDEIGTYQEPWNDLVR